MLTPPPPPPIIEAPHVTMLASFTAGPVVCDGVTVVPVDLVQPRSQAVVRYGTLPEASRSASHPERVTFGIDGDGRPHTIRKAGASVYPGFYLDTSDIEPSLAVSRFPAGAPRTGCTIAYEAAATPINWAPIHALYAVASLPSSGTLPRELWDRLKPATADCPRGPGDPRQVNYPAFETIPQPAGTWSWVFLSYDVDPRGRPEHVRMLDSSGNAALDRAGVAALAHDRFAPGPGYRGCTYHFYHSGRAGEERPLLPPDTPADTGEESACRIDPRSMAGLLDGNAYPPAFSRRRIAGVAAVQYDTAPWGAIGNVKVIASEPADGFGDAARNGIANARVEENDIGHRGCVRRVRFRLPEDSTSR